MSSFYFLELQLITVLLSICDSYMSSSARLVSQKLWDFPFSISFFIKVYNFVHTVLLPDL